MRYQVSHHSLRGARPTNQDRTAVVERDNAVLMAVADGLGGHHGGELAAEVFVQTVAHAFQAVRHSLIQRPSAFLALAILQAHNAIVRVGRQNVPPLEPRTTAVLCLVQDGYAYWAHVGDSRLYHFRDGQLLTRTQDHTSVEQLRQDGLLSDDEIADHPHKSRLLKCVGGPSKPVVSLGEETRLMRGDVLLLCSDGVWEAHKPEKLAAFLTGQDLEVDVENMLLATQRKMKSGCDNVSAVAFRWDDAITRAVPLQGNEAVQVDQERMWKDAHQWMGETRVQQARDDQRADKPADRKNSIKDDISELESFLRTIEPKSRNPS